MQDFVREFDVRQQIKLEQNYRCSNRVLRAANALIANNPAQAVPLAREAVALVRRPGVRVIDASSAHRTAPGWVYGLPELEAGQAERIAHARRVSNPGCYPTGALALLRPLIDAGLLLGQQLTAVNRRHSCRNTAIERAFQAQMGDVGGTDHDLGRDAADIHAGAADGAALDQRDARTLFDGLERSGHRRPAAADDGDVQLAVAVTGLASATNPFAHAVEQPAARRRAWCVSQRGPISEPDDGGE